MKDFKGNWNITKDWQLLYPVVGLVLLLYLSLKVVLSFITIPLVFQVLISLVLAFLLLKIILWIFIKLKDKWEVDERWRLIRIFIVFALTGSSSVFVSRPLIAMMGITKSNLNIFLYYLLFIFVSLVVYQLLLITFGYIFGEFKFFWNFEKKMLKRMGLDIK